jgi:hypothetical protein
VQAVSCSPPSPHLFPTVRSGSAGGAGVRLCIRAHSEGRRDVYNVLIDAGVGLRGCAGEEPYTLVRAGSLFFTFEGLWGRRECRSAGGAIGRGSGARA